jgi:hypothetical protein
MYGSIRLGLAYATLFHRFAEKPHKAICNRKKEQKGRERLDVIMSDRVGQVIKKPLPVLTTARGFGTLPLSKNLGKAVFTSSCLWRVETVFLCLFFYKQNNYSSND